MVNLLNVLQDEGRACGTRRSYARRERLFKVGEPSTSYDIVMSGQVKLVCSRASGRETILELVGPGELLCSGAVWTNSPYCCSAIAVSDVEVMQVPSSALEESMADCPSCARSLLDSSARRSMAMCQRVGETTSGRVDQRIAATILHLAKRGRRLVEGTVLTAQLSRQDIADLCGTTVESAIRTMRSFEKKGWIKAGDEGIVILDERPLRTLAET